MSWGGGGGRPPTHASLSESLSVKCHVEGLGPESVPSSTGCRCRRQKLPTCLKQGHLMTISLTPVPAETPSPNSTPHRIADPSALWPQDPITSAAPSKNRPCCPCYRHHPFSPSTPHSPTPPTPMHHFRCKVSAAKSNISTLELFHPISPIGRRRGGVWRGREGKGRWLQKTMALGTPMGRSDQPTVCTGRDRVVGSGEAADRRVASVLGRGGG